MMRYRTATVLAFAILIAPAGRARGEQELEPSPTPELQAEALVELFEQVAAHHPASPAMQEMVLRTIRHRFGSATAALEATSANWAQHVSQSSGRDQWVDLLTTALGEYPIEDSAVPDAAATPGARWASRLEVLLPADLRSLGVSLLARDEGRVRDQLQANRYVGIGIRVRASDRGVVIGSVFPGGPAANAELRPNDVIVAVDGQSTAGVPLGQSIQWLRGPVDSELTVTVERPLDDGPTKKFDQPMVRSVVPLATLSEPQLSESGRSVKIDLKQILASTAHELRRAAAALQPEVERVVLDFTKLSSDGELHNFLVLAGALVDGGPLGEVLSGDGRRRSLSADRGSIFGNRELVIIGPRHLSGLAIWLTAAIQQSGSGLLTGHPIYGTAWVSQRFDLQTVPVSVELITGVMMDLHGNPLVYGANDAGGQFGVGNPWTAAVPAPVVIERKPQSAGTPDGYRGGKGPRPRRRPGRDIERSGDMMAGGYPMIQQQPQPLLKPDVPLRKLDVDSIERAIEAAAATDENEEVEATQSAGADEAR